MTWKASGFNDEGTFTPDELTVKVEQAEVRTIAHSAALSRGTVLGKVTASGKLIESLAAANDGSQTPSAVLFEDVDASTADGSGVVLIKGTVNQNSLIYGAGHSASTVYDPLRDVNINLIKAVI